MKRILSLILVLVMVLGVMPMASATTPELTVDVTGDVIAGQDYTVTITAPTDYTFANKEAVNYPWADSAKNATLSEDGKTLTVVYTAGSGDAGKEFDFDVSATLTYKDNTTVENVLGSTKLNVLSHSCVFSTTADTSLSDPATCVKAGKNVFKCTIDGCSLVKEVAVAADGVSHKDTSNPADGKCDNLKDDGTACGANMNEYSIGGIANDSSSTGYYTLTPILYKNGEAVSGATFTFSGDATGTGASILVTGDEQVKSVTVSVATGADGATVAPVPVRISFYDANYDVEVTMEDGITKLDFDDSYDIEETSTVAAKLCATTYKNTARIHFTNLSTTGGKITLYTNISSDYSALYSALGDAYFTPSAGGPGYFATSYVWKDPADEKLIYGAGVLTINYDDIAGAITYQTTNSKEVVFDEDDFDEYWEDCGMGGYPEYVVFDGQPFYGDLYTDTTMKTKIDDTDKFYYGATSSRLDLDVVTYKPYTSLSSYDDEIGFTMYGDEADEVVYGTVVIEVGQKMNFTDVKTTDYFYDAVQWAVNKDITAGTSATTFSPNATCTRAQVVTFLYRAAGEPTVSGSMPFTDVKLTDYYYDAVLWAYKNDITTGLTATTFGPNSTVTRGQVVTFLCRALEGKASSSYNPFTDVKSTDYFYDAVLWAVKNDVTTGLTATTFGPNSGCTRGQIVTFLYRAYEGE